MTIVTRKCSLPKSPPGNVAILVLFVSMSGIVILGEFSICFMKFSIQFNSIKYMLTFIHHYMSIIIIIHCIFLIEKSKRICRKLNKLIRDISGITHNQFT